MRRFLTARGPVIRWIRRSHSSGDWDPSPATRLAEEVAISLRPFVSEDQSLAGLIWRMEAAHRWVGLMTLVIATNEVERYYPSSNWSS